MQTSGTIPFAANVGLKAAEQAKAVQFLGAFDQPFADETDLKQLNLLANVAGNNAANTSVFPIVQKEMINYVQRAAELLYANEAKITANGNAYAAADNSIGAHSFGVRTVAEAQAIQARLRQVYGQNPQGIQALAVALKDHRDRNEYDRILSGITEKAFSTGRVAASAAGMFGRP